MRTFLRLVSELASRRNGARIPSIAEDVATELVTIFSLSFGLRRYRFDKESFTPMVPSIRPALKMARGKLRIRWSGSIITKKFLIFSVVTIWPFFADSMLHLSPIFFD